MGYSPCGCKESDTTEQHILLMCSHNWDWPFQKRPSQAVSGALSVTFTVKVQRGRMCGTRFYWDILGIEEGAWYCPVCDEGPAPWVCTWLQPFQCLLCPQLEKWGRGQDVVVHF